MGVTEEIFRLRYETDLDSRVPRLQSLLQGVQDRMTRIRLAQEKPVSDTVWKQMERDAARYRAEIGRVELAQQKAAYARQQAFNRLGEGDAVRPSVVGGAVVRGGSGVGGRGAALGRTGFALANLGQDLAQGGAGAGLNNILQPMLWDDLAKAIGGGRLALAGFGTAAIAAGAGYIAIDRGLKHASLGWGDFLDVVGNLAPIEGAGQAIEGFGMMLKDSGVIDFVDTFVGDVADYTLGWRDATEAVRQHKQVLGETKANQQGVASAAAKFRSEQQKTADAQGERFGQALADLGGTGGIQGIATKLGKGTQGTINAAIGGNARDQKRIVDMLGQMGMDTGGLEAAMLGPGMGIDEVVAQVKAENDLIVRQQAEDDAKQKAKQDRDSRRRHEVDAAMRSAKAGAIEDVPFARMRVQAGLEQRLGQGMGADQAAAEVAQGLVTAIGDAIPEADAQEAAKAFVDEQLAAMKDADAAAKLSGPFAATMRQLDLQQSALGLQSAMGGSFSQGPQTMSAGSFAQNVQDSQKPLIDLQREQIDLQRQQIEYLQKVADNTRMNTLVGA